MEIKQTVGGAVKAPVKATGNPQVDLMAAQSSPEAAEFIAEFYKRQIARMDVEDEVSAALKEKKRQEHLMTVAENEKKRLADQWNQEACTHLNQLGSATAVRGNRDGSRKVIAFCQRCQKVWKEQESGGFLDSLGKWMPPHIQPDPDKHVGGIA